MTDYTKYSTPESVMRDQNLAYGEKLKILKNWQNDVRRRLDSTAENMASSDSQATSDNADALREINQTLDYLHRRQPAKDDDVYTGSDAV